METAIWFVPARHRKRSLSRILFARPHRVHRRHEDSGLDVGEPPSGLLRRFARRTVAKYREAMRIPSSVQRRRDKQAAMP